MLPADRLPIRMRRSSNSSSLHYHHNSEAWARRAKVSVVEALCLLPSRLAAGDMAIHSLLQCTTINPNPKVHQATLRHIRMDILVATVMRRSRT